MACVDEAKAASGSRREDRDGGLRRVESRQPGAAAAARVRRRSYQMPLKEIEAGPGPKKLAASM